jgi:hypothetical protein
VPPDSLETIAPGLSDRIAEADAAAARRFAFGVARLACGVAGVRDRTALDIAAGGLERDTAVAELVRLWRLERRLDAACEARLDPDAAYPDVTELRLRPECTEARAVASVVAALKPNPHLAAAEAAYEAWASGCDQDAIEALAHRMLGSRA